MSLDRDDAYDLASRAVKALEKIAEFADFELGEMRHRAQLRESYSREVADLHPGHDERPGDEEIQSAIKSLGEALTANHDESSDGEPQPSAAVDDKAPSAG